MRIAVGAAAERIGHSPVDFHAVEIHIPRILGIPVIEHAEAVGRRSVDFHPVVIYIP